MDNLDFCGIEVSAEQLVVALRREGHADIAGWLGPRGRSGSVWNRPACTVWTWPWFWRDVRGCK